MSATNRWLLVALSVFALVPACSSDNPAGPSLPDPDAPPQPDPELTATVVASGLTSPQGVTVDDRGRIWIAEQGTGADDGRVSVVSSDGTVHPFLVDVPSVTFQGSAESLHHVEIRDGELWGTLGLGEADPRGFVLRADLAGWSPGDAPRTMADVILEEVGSVVLEHDFAVDTDQTNVYNLTFDDVGNLYLVDASANAVLRRDAGTGAFSVLAEFQGIPNSTGEGPPEVQAVPTGVVFHGGRLLVTAFPGFPFADEEGRVYEVTLSGEVTELHAGFTGAVDLDVGSQGDLFVAEFGRFMNGFQPGSGVVTMVADGVRETLLDEIDFPAGIAVDSGGDILFTSFSAGELLRIDME